MTKVTADIIFGVPPVGESVAAPDQVIQQEDVEIEFELEAPRVRRSTSSIFVPCPEAGPNDFPTEEAPTSIVGMPRAGTYRWKQSGSDKIPTFPFPLPISGFGSRQVKDVTGNPGSFTFKTVEDDPSLSTNTLITRTFTVSSSGLSLTRIEWDDNRDGTPERTFAPTLTQTVKGPAEDGDVSASPEGIPYLPIPFQVNETVDSTGVDPVSRSTMRHIAVVKERRRVDACGTVLDSWYLDADQTFDGIRMDFNYSVATHFGGLLISEHIERICSSTDGEGMCQPPGDLKFDSSIGQVDPS